MTTAQLLTIEGVSKSFPGVQALKDVKLNLNSGEVLALVGENGAGKSTLMKVLSGIYKRDEGIIKLNNQEINVYHNSINADGITINECIEKKTLLRLYKNYHNSGIQLLAELNPEKVKLYEYSEFHIIETGKN